jgi:hypothetical protein
LPSTAKLIRFDEYSALWKSKSTCRISIPRCLGVVLNDSVLPIENPEYGCLGSDVDFSNWETRHGSLNKFPSYSELTASNSRSVDDAAKSGEIKNWAKLNQMKIFIRLKIKRRLHLHIKCIW